MSHFAAKRARKRSTYAPYLTIKNNYNKINKWSPTAKFWANICCYFCYCEAHVLTIQWFVADFTCSFYQKMGHSVLSRPVLCQGMTCFRLYRKSNRQEGFSLFSKWHFLTIFQNVSNHLGKGPKGASGFEDNPTWDYPLHNYLTLLSPLGGLWKLKQLYRQSKY